MLSSWRWFGPDDPVSLENVREAGATGVVSALDHIPTGEVWPADEIVRRKELIERHGLSWVVVESVPVHNHIKARTGESVRYTGNYCETIRNLGSAGIRRVCYNFMPVVDWTRTHLRHPAPDGGLALRFDMTTFVAFDVFVLARRGAADDYDARVVADAERAVHAMSAPDRETLERTIIAGLPGGEGSYDRAGLLSALDDFADLDADDLGENLRLFLTEVVPAAEESGVKLAIHPDDPPIPLFGLPRVVSTADDVRRLFADVPSAHNGLTFCSGSFGSRPDNDLVAMAVEFLDRIHFAHLRNVIRSDDGSFAESGHLDGDIDMVALIEVLHRHKDRDDLPCRPDHGLLYGPEKTAPNVRPGYSWAGRMKGLAELKGLGSGLALCIAPSKVR